MFSKKILTGFRIYLNFRVGQTRLDRLDGLDFVGNGDKEQFLSHCTTGASSRPHRADLPAFCHGLVWHRFWPPANRSASLIKAEHTMALLPLLPIPPAGLAALIPYRSSDGRSPPNDESFCNRREGSAGSALCSSLCTSSTNACRGDGMLN
jgi:hypothetical protein